MCLYAFFCVHPGRQHWDLILESAALFRRAFLEVISWMHVIQAISPPLPKELSESERNTAQQTKNEPEHIFTQFAYCSLLKGQEKRGQKDKQSTSATWQ